MSFASKAIVRAKQLHVALYRRFDVKPIRTIKGQPILLLTVVGRRSGRPMTTPVVYLPDGEAYVVAGSNNGAKSDPQWFKNLRAASTAHVEVGAASFDAAVQELTGAEHERVWSRLLETAPFFEGYRTKSGRPIPLARLTPVG